MRALELELPRDVLDLHVELRVDHVIRARLTRLKLPYDGFGFFSWNGDNSYFTQLSRMIDYGGYGVNKIIRKVRNGTDVDKAIDHVAGYWGCGETEIPHIESVIPMTPNLTHYRRMGIEFTRSPNSSLYKDAHDTAIDAILILDFHINEEPVELQSADARFLNFWDQHRRLLPRRV
jgi:hypothetical protein